MSPSVSCFFAGGVTAGTATVGTVAGGGLELKLLTEEAPVTKAKMLISDAIRPTMAIVQFSFSVLVTDTIYTLACAARLHSGRVGANSA